MVYKDGCIILNFEWFTLMWLMNNLHWFILLLGVGIAILFFFPVLLGYDLTKKGDSENREKDIIDE